MKECKCASCCEKHKYMKNNQIAIIPYDLADWVWVSNHYDIHLSGLLLYEGELCKFETNELTDVIVYRMSMVEKLKAIIDKKMFEWCVGYHWSYPEREQGIEFHWRKPHWFYRLLYFLYFKYYA